MSLTVYKVGYLPRELARGYGQVFDRANTGALVAIAQLLDHQPAAR